MNRQEEISALLKTVRDEGGGVYSVESLSPDLPGWRYLVRPRQGATAATCECDDFKFRAHKASGVFRCKHILAVRAYHQTNKEAPAQLPGDDQDEADEEPEGAVLW